MSRLAPFHRSGTSDLSEASAIWALLGAGGYLIICLLSIGAIALALALGLLLPRSVEALGISVAFLDLIPEPDVGCGEQVDVGRVGALERGEAGGLPFGGPQNILQGNQDLSWVKGNHTMRFGGQYNYEQVNRAFAAYDVNHRPSRIVENVVGITNGWQRVYDSPGSWI